MSYEWPPLTEQTVQVVFLPGYGLWANQVATEIIFGPPGEACGELSAMASRASGEHVISSSKTPTRFVSVLDEQRRKGRRRYRGTPSSGQDAYANDNVARSILSSLQPTQDPPSLPGTQVPHPRLSTRGYTWSLPGESFCTVLQLYTEQSCWRECVH